MILQKIFLINFCIFGFSIAHPSTESQPSTLTTILPKLNTTSLNTILSNYLNSSSINSTINKPTSNSSIPKNILTNLEPISTKIEKPKELISKKSKKENSTIRSTNQDEIDANQPLTEELDNNSTFSLSNSNYSSLSDDVLTVNDDQFNKFNPISFDLINDSLNDTLVDDSSLNSTNRSG